MATRVKNIAKEIVGETKSSMTENKEVWWWDEEIQRVKQFKLLNIYLFIVFNGQYPFTKYKLWQKSRKRED